MVQGVLLLLLLVQTHYVYQNFVPNNSEKALHGARMATPVDTTNLTSLVGNYHIARSSLGLKEEERVQPKANTTSPVIDKLLNSDTKFNHTNQTLTPFRIQFSDQEYKSKRRQKTFPTIVIEKYKLLFFSSPKVGCTHWHLLFMRMEQNRTYTLDDEYIMSMFTPFVN